MQSDSGEALHVLSEIQFVIAGHKFSHNLHVVSGLNRNLIWGNDWMGKNGVRIYFDLKKLRVGNVDVPYKQDIHILSLVRVVKTKVLKPQTAEVLQVRMKDAPYFTGNAVRYFRRVYSAGARVVSNEYCRETKQ